MERLPLEENFPIPGREWVQDVLRRVVLVAVVEVAKRKKDRVWEKVLIILH